MSIWLPDLSRGVAAPRKVLLQPIVRRGAPPGMKALEEVPAEVFRALAVEAVELLVRRNPPDTQPLELAGRADQLAVFERLELAVERRVELDLFDPGADLSRGHRQPLRRRGRDLHDKEMRRNRGPHQRDQRRVRGVAAVPVRLTVKLDGMVQERQTGRGEDGVDRQLAVGQNSQPSVANPGRAEEELDLRPFA